MHDADLISLEPFLMRFCVMRRIWITFLGVGQKKGIRERVMLFKNIH